MKAGYLFWAIVVIFTMVTFPSQAFARDPGIPDTVSFGECTYELVGPPYEGTLILPLLVSNDEYLSSIDIPLKWSGPMVCDSGRFVGERPQHFTCGSIAIDTTFQYIYVCGVAMGDPIPPGEGVLAYLYISLTDTGLVAVDSSIFGPAEAYLHFVDVTIQVVNPQMVEFECQIVAPSGDVNSDGQMDIGDVVFLINYLYKQGPPPEFIEVGDVNGDGIVDIGDIVFLINYLFRAGPQPKNRCPH